MASRRMFSLRIINSAKFLKMPVSSRALYFHLGMNADDDGVVEAYNIINQVGATEDDLRVLVSKGFAVVLNEDLVTYLTDWTEHNKIRADRKVDSIYQDLLIQVVDDVQLLEKKQRSDVKCVSGQTMDGPLTDTGRKMDRIGKDRLGQDSIGKDNCSSSEPLWKRLTTEEIESLNKMFFDADDLIATVSKEVKERKRKVDDAYAYIVGWADNNNWYRN